MSAADIFSVADAIIRNVRKISIIVSAVMALLFAACGQQPKADDVVAQTAKAYYDYLLRGEYANFVDGTYRPDSIPATYREQLVVNAKMYVAQLNEEHGGISSVTAVGAQVDTARNMASAFLMFAFGDSTREQVVVPMVCCQGVWYMR